MSNMPIREYASSSTRVVLLRAAHDIRLATLTTSRDSVPFRIPTSMPVISCTTPAKVCLVPIGRQFIVRKVTVDGAMSSWRVQPRVNHVEARNFDRRSRGSSASSTSCK